MPISGLEIVDTYIDQSIYGFVVACARPTEAQGRKKAIMDRRGTLKALSLQNSYGKLMAAKGTSVPFLRDLATAVFILSGYTYGRHCFNLGVNNTNHKNITYFKDVKKGSLSIHTKV